MMKARGFSVPQGRDVSEFLPWGDAADLHVVRDWLPIPLFLGGVMAALEDS